jgi:hypothetical protein
MEKISFWVHNYFQNGIIFFFFFELVICRVETIILKDMKPTQCLQNSLEFLKKRKMEVSRSSAVLNNSNQALRLISNSGLINKK